MTLPNGTYKTCANCGKGFYVQAHRADRAKFCSRECLWEGRTPRKRTVIVVICEVCERPFDVEPNRENTARFCSRSCMSIGYRKNPETYVAPVRRYEKHGLSKSLEYICYLSMIARCKRDPHYTGRGIRVCDRWLANFSSFYEDMGPMPGPGYEIDRFPERDGNYEPDNCRWATAKEQGWSSVGAHNANSKLTEQDVLFIRSQEGVTSRRILGKRFGVRQDYIRDIQKRKSWVHLE